MSNNSMGGGGIWRLMEKSIFFHFDCLTTSLGQNFPKFTKDKIMGDTFIIGYMPVMSENITHKRHNKEK